MKRQIARDGDRLNLGVGAQPLFETLVEREPLLDRRILAIGQHQLHGEQMRGLDADVESIQREEAAHHEAGAGQQHERQRELPDDERAGPPSRSHARRARAAALFQHFVHVGLRHV